MVLDINYSKKKLCRSTKICNEEKVNFNRQIQPINPGRLILHHKKQTNKGVSPGLKALYCILINRPALRPRHMVFLQQ